MVSNPQKTRYLALDHLAVNRALARRLPPAVAFRYHALPIAKDNSHITVAMAHPEDRAACEAVALALKTELCVVQSDPEAIDLLLAEVWPEAVNRSLSLLLYTGSDSTAASARTYARYLADLLRGQLNYFVPDHPTEAGFDDLVEKAACGHELVIFAEPEQSLIERLLSGPKGCQAAQRLPASVVIARQPRWPLKRILLVTRGQGLDDVAIDWIVRLAQPSQAAVTVLAVQTSMSGLESRALQMGGLIDWLVTDTPLGRQLRHIAGRLANWEIEGKLRFRQGSPNAQIQSEVSESDPDLIVIAADPSSWLLRRIPGQIVSPLLRWIDRPVLIAKVNDTKG